MKQFLICDRIYALFGICQDIHIDTKLIPDYVKSEKDVVHDTISYICCVEVSAAAKNGHIHIVQFLMDNGADVNSRSTTKLASLSAAVKNGHIHIVQVLLEHGAGEANVDQRFRLDARHEEIGNVECTPLAFATQKGNKDLVKLLLAYGANPNIRDSKGKPPLFWAERARQWDLHDLLVREGAEWEVKGV